MGWLLVCLCACVFNQLNTVWSWLPVALRLPKSSAATVGLVQAPLCLCKDLPCPLQAGWSRDPGCLPFLRAHNVTAGLLGSHYMVFQHLRGL